MDNTIKLISKYDQTLVKVIQWLDETNTATQKFGTRLTQC
jgi:hypothetical protein